nr:hypothetical protein [Tanacetum cinerariifolium]
ATCFDKLSSNSSAGERPVSSCALSVNRGWYVTGGMYEDCRGIDDDEGSETTLSRSGPRYGASVPEAILSLHRPILNGPSFKVDECSLAPTARPIGGLADYGFVGTLDAEIRCDPDREIGYGITDVWEDLDEIAEEIPVNDMADGQLSLLRRDRCSHARMARLMDSEVRASRKAWVQYVDASDMARSKRPGRDPTLPDVLEEKMAPTKRTTRASPDTTTTTTPVTNAKLKALIDQGVADAFAAHDTEKKAKMAMTTIIQERVVEEQNKLLMSVHTLTFSNANP